MNNFLSCFLLFVNCPQLRLILLLHIVMYVQALCSMYQSMIYTKPILCLRFCASWLVQSMFYPFLPKFKKLMCSELLVSKDSGNFFDIAPSVSHRNPIYASGGVGSWWPQHRPRWAAFQPDGADTQDPLQSDVLHWLHHWRGFPHWGRSVPTTDLRESIKLMSYFVGP